MNWHSFAIVAALAVAGPPLAEEFGGLVGKQLRENPYSCGQQCDLPRIDYARPACGESLELLHFWRPNCPVSVKTQRRVRTLQAQGYKIRSINTLTNRELSSRYQINATPTFITLDNGVVVHRVAAGLDKGEIAELLSP
ncbi:hypothetical protein Pla123a_05330 [Posidoniimonas polymericola]|uniref:Thioredoxin domain-containing protein n=1 Tax=Posidoniimonas polymericola TaxID=2528002 RepID=A0A5C5ZEY3_9BACT|nr:thioredoxin family protein [Posidoniimonas polymericola]TWT85726.1 hypothetical protein Pla123a_05330 [Posidoniimonas polymericola]